MSRGELTASAYTMLYRGQQREALTIFRMATFLYPDDPGSHRALAEGLFLNGDKNTAIAELDKALELNKDQTQIKAILEQRDKMKK